ncbi:MAG: response regulator [Roseburia sp.]|nr:response regulator [Roseburia sp.]
MELIDGKVPKILIVDDTDINIMIIKKCVEKMGYTALTATSAKEAVNQFYVEMPQMVLLDIVMPDVDGYQLCDVLKGYAETRDIPIIFISSNNTPEDRRKAYEFGGIDFIGKPFQYEDMELIINKHMRIYAKQKRIEDDKKRMNKIISEQTKEFEEEQKRLLTVIARLGEDEALFGGAVHQEHVAENARLIAEALNFTERYANQISESYTEGIRVAASIHDLGKITIPREIITKPGPLTAKEREIVNTHTTAGYEIIREVYPNIENNQMIKIAVEVIRSHHENYDGSGYPDGLSGEDIPLTARIVRIADTFDSMLRAHCYRPAYERSEVLQMMESERGKKYDPYLLDVFFKIEKQMKV